VGGLLSGAVSASGLEQMNHFLRGLKNLQAGFEQSVLSSDQRQASRSQGMFYLQRPGRFRWDYSEPDRQQIIADGKQVWMLEPELEQVSVQNQDDALRGTPALFLVDGDPVENHFEVIDIGASQGFEWVELIPRDQEGQFVRILLAFSDNLLQRMEMTDAFGQISRFQFYDIVQNPVFKHDFFVYERPFGFDLYEH
jgi:outer membrane lipoprotein carrier protein